MNRTKGNPDMEPETNPTTDLGARHESAIGYVTVTTDARDEESA